MRRPPRGGTAGAALAAVVALVLAGCAGDRSGDSGGSAGPDGAEAEATPSAASRPFEGQPGWEPVAGLAVPRDDFVSAVVDGEIWVMGGMTGDRGNRLDSIEVYDPEADTWTTSEITMPRGLASFEGAAIGDDIYVFGGLDADTKPTAFSAVLETDTGRWRDLPPLPTARYAHTVTEHEGRIYVVGGESVAGVVPTVDVFDPRTGRWSQGEDMPDARGSHDAVSTPQGLYVLGGWLDGGPTELVQRYDPTAGVWSTETPMPEPVSRAGATLLDGRVWVAFHEFAATLDLGTGEWTRANHPPLSRHGLGFVPLGDRIYAIAGCQEWPLRDVRTVDVLEPA